MAFPLVFFKMILTAALIALAVLPSNALFWPASTASQAPLFQPPQALGSYAQPTSHSGYDTEPSTTTPLPSPPPPPVLPTAW
jgi:hypothetical protein